MATEVTVPTLGESITEATLGQWLKQPGDPVKADEPIASLETDKVAVEVPSPIAGVMGEQIVAEGDNVEVGAVIARIEAGNGAAAQPEASEAAPSSTPVNPQGAGENIELRDEEEGEDEGDGGHLTLSPAVRRVVLEHGLDPSKIKGTGKDGRLTKDDVLAAAKAQKSEAPSVAPPPPPPPSQPQVPVQAATGERREERVRMTRLRQTIASRLKEAQNTAALLTTFNDVDMSAVIEARGKYKDLFAKKHGIRLGFMGFFAKAAAWR
jgi:2-oxoglutarate dehydrogenase E2 component (dihydrolipoamide succinyltransferase)